MREHLRETGRYFRTEPGTLIVDWGSNGADYRALDFSYVARGKGGNLYKLYGQVRRNEDGENYDTYDIKAGRSRLVTRGSGSIEAAVRAYIEVTTYTEAYNLDVEAKMPPVPASIRDELSVVIMKAITKWDFFWRGEAKGWTDEQKQRAREAFVISVWDSGKFYCGTMSSKKSVVSVGLLNVDVGEYGNLYKLWRESCEAIEKV